VVEDWAMAPGVSHPFLLMCALCYLFVLQDKQHSRARAAQPGARHAHTKGILCMVRAEKSVRQPLCQVSSVASSQAISSLQNMGPQRAPGGAGTHASRKADNSKLKPAVITLLPASPNAT